MRGYSGVHAADYVAATSPAFAVGEFWDSLTYDGNVPRRNQDAHRQRTVNWINQAAGGSTAFDVTTKGILHAVFEVTLSSPTTTESNLVFERIDVIAQKMTKSKDSKRPEDFAFCRALKIQCLDFKELFMLTLSWKPCSEIIEGSIAFNTTAKRVRIDISL